jgi:FkbM family methyltransferase
MNRTNVPKFEEQVLSLYLRSLGPSLRRVIVDVGGNSEANFSAPFALEGWECLIVEPQPHCVERLRSTFAGLPNVRIVQKACSDRDGELKLYQGKDGPGSEVSTLSEASDPWMNQVRSEAFSLVEVQTLTGLLEEHGTSERIGVLKVDTESWDYLVLKGCDLHRFGPQVIVTEEYFWNIDQTIEKHLLLERNGYVNVGFVGYNSVWTSKEAGAAGVYSILHNWLLRVGRFPMSAMGDVFLFDSSYKWDGADSFTGAVEDANAKIALAAKVDCMRSGESESVDVLFLNIPAEEASELTVSYQWLVSNGDFLIERGPNMELPKEDSGVRRLSMEVVAPRQVGSLILEFALFQKTNLVQVKEMTTARQSVVVLESSTSSAPADKRFTQS